MTFPIQITYQGLEPSDALSAHITEVARKLDEVYDRIERCEIVVESPHRHSQRAPRFHVRVHLHVPGPDIIVDHDDGGGDAHDDPYIAARDAVRAARRRLEVHIERLREGVRPRSRAR